MQFKRMLWKSVTVLSKGHPVPLRVAFDSCKRAAESLVDLVWNTNRRAEAFNNPRPLTERPARAQKLSYDSLRAGSGSGNDVADLIAKMESLDKRELQALVQHLRHNFRCLSPQQVILHLHIR